MNWIDRSGNARAIGIKNFARSLCCALVLLSACDSKSPEEKFAHEADTIVSWTETAREVAAAWRNNSVPQDYARRALATSGKNLQDEREKVRSFALAPDLQDQTLNQLQTLVETIEQMKNAIERKDREALAPEIEQLERTKETIIALAKNSRKQA